MIINLIRNSAGDNHCHDYNGVRVVYTDIVDMLLKAWPEAKMEI